MPPSHGIKTRRTSHTSHLTRRANQNSSGIIVGLVFLGILVIGLVFCAVVTILICKNNAAQKRRNKTLQEQNQHRVATVNHNYQKIQDVEGGAQELSSGGQIYDPVPYRSVELQGDGQFRKQGPQEVDGSVAAPALTRAPVELPPEARTR